MRYLLLVSALLGACRSEDFAPPSLVESVRILATAADKPYATPGDTVNMEVLAFDGRASQTEPMGIWWLPAPCIDPPNDNYYQCYSAFGNAYRPGVDLTNELTPGKSFSFQMPSDAIARHDPTRGGTAYGLAVLFTIACAGHVEYVSPPSGAPVDTLPFACFDANHTQLGANDFVFAYSFVYAFANRVNTNPVLQSVTLAGSPVDPSTGISVNHCTKSNIDKCPTVPLDVVIPDSSDELDPGDLDVNGNALKEQIYVDYYLTAGKMQHDTIGIFDPRAGRLSNTANDLYAPQTQGDFNLWVVAHDNRGGVAWQQLPLQAL